MQEVRFTEQLNKAVESVRRILDNTRIPTFPHDTPHKYEDKYILAHYITHMAIAAEINCLEYLGLTEKSLKTILDWYSGKSAVTLRFKSTETCKFNRTETKEVTSPTKYVTEIASTNIIGQKSNTTITDKVVTTVTTHFWDFNVEYELFAYKGNNPEDKVVLQERKGKIELVSSVKSQPYPETSVKASLDLNIGWLLAKFDSKLNLKFEIDRTSKLCHTPRRNPEIDGAYYFFRTFHDWAESVRNYLSNQLFSVQTGHQNYSSKQLDLTKMNDSSLFIPVIPLFDGNKKSSDSVDSSGVLVNLSLSAKDSPVLPLTDMYAFLKEEKRSINEKFDELNKMYPNEKIITPAEAKIIVIADHLKRISKQFGEGIDYIELMLRNQLIAAIGKVVTPVDFTNYMKYHNRQLFRPEYEPRLFCYAVRRPDHYPEGTLSIEGQLDDGTLADPIPTIVKSGEAVRPMFFNINAATKIAFHGERHLHAWVNHQFSGYSGTQLNLVARARQFSSFILMVGTIISADAFEPKHAIIIQNKDDLKIPLMLETIPTPKEFRDAIESLSPEQQRFAKAYRGMQLSSTLFAVCVIQIKPQLEKLLNLPYDSLTKEIKLTQDLLELFIKYQIPSDLLSFGGHPKESDPTKLNAVKNHVNAMQEMIRISQQKELEEKKKIDEYNRRDLEREVVYKSSSRMREMEMDFFSAPTQTFMSAPSFDSDSIQLNSTADFKESVMFEEECAIVDDIQPEVSDSIQEDSSDNKETTKDDLKKQLSKSTKNVEDYTKLPAKLDAQFDALDPDSALRSTIIKPSDYWTRSSQKALLASPTTQGLSTEEQKTERNIAFDLLDALSRSGALSIDYASLHVVLAATHCFDKDLMNTVIQDNVNPIEKVERSVLIVASTVHGKEALELVNDDQLERVSTYSPLLFPEGVGKKEKVLEGKSEKALEEKK